MIRLRRGAAARAGAGPVHLTRLQARSDEAIDYSELPGQDEAFFRPARVEPPPVKQQLTIGLDEELLAWLKGQGKGDQTERFRKCDSATCKRCHTLEAIQGTRADTAAIHREETDGKTCIDCHDNWVHREVPRERTFKREAWNRMVEEEFGLDPGTAERILNDAG